MRLTMLLQTQTRVEPHREHEFDTFLCHICLREHLGEFIRQIRAAHSLAIISIDEESAHSPRLHHDADSPSLISAGLGWIDDDGITGPVARGVEAELRPANIDHEESATFSSGHDIALLRGVLTLDGVAVSDPLDKAGRRDAIVIDMEWPDEASEHAGVETGGVSCAMEGALLDWRERSAS